MFNKIFMLGTAVAIAATTASAYEIKDSEVTLGWDRLDASGGTFDGVFATGETTLMFNDQFGAELGLGLIWPDGSTVDYGLRLSGAANYYFGQGAYAGAFLDYTHRQGNPGIGDTIYVYGLQGGYETDVIDLFGYLGIGDYSDLGAPEDSETYGLSLAYKFQSGWDLGGFFQGERIASTTYEQYGVSLGYEFEVGTSVPFYVVGALGRTEAGGGSADQFSLSVSIPIGDGAVSKGRKSFHKRSALNNILGTAGTF